MELAGEIHKVLVPDINIDDDIFEITGRSNPTDEVGGDLIDFISDDDETIVYMIDVSGHGVGPGLLSGMFKSSFRSIYKKNNTLHYIVSNLNRVLLDQRKKGMFITFCGLRFYERNQIEFILAGHPPIIRIDQDGNFEELKITQLPLLTLLNSEFKFETITSQPGDLFVIYSDGIIETTDKKGEEFGFERFKEILLSSFSLPTAQISEEVYRKLDAYGSSHDDQSLIIIRRK
jgi:sigma-B regulation protein RsbU (phosphoserine phosphatase)